MKRTKIIICVFALLAFAISSCTKQNEPKPSIIGGWFQQSIGGTDVRSMFFGREGSFEATFGSYNDATPGVNTRVVYSGTYTIKGNSIITNIGTVSVQENGGTPVVSPTAQKLYENATFSVTADKLTIDYDALSPGGTTRIQTVFSHAMED